MTFFFFSHKPKGGFTEPKGIDYVSNFWLKVVIKKKKVAKP